MSKKVALITGITGQDVSKLHGLGWKHSVDLKDGIEKMYSWYKGNNK